MKSISTLKGTNLLSDLAIDLYPSSLKFYGNKYKTIIDSTLSRTILYEWNNESPYEVISDITKGKVNSSEAEILAEKHKDSYGLHYISRSLFTGIKHFVVVKNVSNKDELAALLAHELYGHAVCSDYNTYMVKDGYYSSRNGIDFLNLKNGVLINQQANEGMIEYIALQIMHIYSPNFKRPKNNYVYNDAVEVARQIFKYIDKETMLELLVKGKGSIEKLFDKENVYSWRALSQELENKKPDIDEYLDGFVKRYKYGNR